MYDLLRYVSDVCSVDSVNLLRLFQSVAPLPQQIGMAGLAQARMQCLFDGAWVGEMYLQCCSASRQSPVDTSCLGGRI